MVKHTQTIRWQFVDKLCVSPFLGLALKGLMYYFPGQILKTIVEYHVNHTHFLAEETINLLVTCLDIFLQNDGS